MATINIDLVRVSEIFISLLSNAVKFTPKDGQIDFVIICDKLELDFIHDRIIVRDTGMAKMPAEIRRLVPKNKYLL